MVVGGRMAPKTGGRREVVTPATPCSVLLLLELKLFYWGIALQAPLINIHIYPTALYERLNNHILKDMQ